MSDTLIHVLLYILSEDYQYPLPAAYAKILQDAHVPVLHAAKGSSLTVSGAPVSGVYVLLDGSCSAEKITPFGRQLSATASNPVQIFGLLESSSLSYTCYVTTQRCLSDCAYLCIPSEEYLYMLRHSNVLCMLNLQFLSRHVLRIMDENDLLLLPNIRDRILLYLYHSGDGAHFPFRLPVKREAMAQNLNISLRTLFRQLDALEEEGIICIEHGKIILTQAQHTHLRRILADFVS